MSRFSPLKLYPDLKILNPHFPSELHECVARQVEDIDTVCYRDVPLVWYGMAEVSVVFDA